MSQATRLLGEMLNANRVFYGTIEPDGDTAHVGSVFANGVAQASGAYSLKAFAPMLVPDWQQGRVTIAEDVEVDRRFTEVERSAYASVEARSALGVPLVKAGRLQAILGLNTASPTPSFSTP